MDDRAVIELVGMPAVVDLAPIHRAVNAAPDPVAAAERACRWFNTLYHRPHPAHTDPHLVVTYRRG